MAEGASKGPPPPPLKNAIFFLFKIKKCLECSQTKEYEKMFCEVFASVSGRKGAKTASTTVANSQLCERSYM